MQVELPKEERERGKLDNSLREFTSLLREKSKELKKKGTNKGIDDLRGRESIAASIYLSHLSDDLNNLHTSGDLLLYDELFIKKRQKADLIPEESGHKIAQDYFLETLGIPSWLMQSFFFKSQLEKEAEKYQFTKASFPGKFSNVEDFTIQTKLSNLKLVLMYEEDEDYPFACVLSLASESE